MRLFLAVMVISAQCGATASAQNTYGLPPTPPEPQYHGAVNTQPPPHLPPKTLALLRLGEEGAELRAGDGGHLTAEHRAYLQQKLNAIQAGKF
jgi:hypothetical protein